MTDKLLRLLVKDRGDDIVAKVEEVLVDRYKGASLVSEADYLAGAMVVLQALMQEEDSDDLTSAIPPLWIFGPMGGRSVVVSVLEKQKADVRFIKEVQRSTSKRGYQLASLDRLVEFAWTVYKSCESKVVRGSHMTPMQTMQWLREEARMLLDDMFEEENE